MQSFSEQYVTTANILNFQKLQHLVLNFLLLRFTALEVTFDTSPALDANNKKACILSELSHTKENNPQRTLSRHRYRKQRLRKRENVEQHAEDKHYDSRAEREASEKVLNGLPYILKKLLQCRFVPNWLYTTKLNATNIDIVLRFAKK